VLSTHLLLAFGLMLVLEGILPFVAPALWKQVFRQATELADGQVRTLGLVSLLLGMLMIVLLG
jgi:uncharacterized protein YjeT (DUF2065 family)